MFVTSIFSLSHNFFLKALLIVYFSSLKVFCRSKIKTGLYHIKYCMMTLVFKHTVIVLLKSCTGSHEPNCFAIFNPFPNKPWFLRVSSTSLLKTLWEKEKLLIISNFSFPPSVFYPFGELSSIFIKIELSSANSFSMEESKICCLGKG